jgi:hypothetical protein
VSDFEKAVLEQLTKIAASIKGLEDGQKNLEAGQKKLASGQEELKEQVKENTAILKALKHRAEVNKAEHDKMSMDIAKLSGSVTGLRTDMSAVEIIVAHNNLDVAKLKAAANQ